MSAVEPTEIDLDAILAAQAEAAGDAHKVVWGGQTFAVRRINDWPLSALDLMAQGQLTSGLALILGDDWDAFWQAREPTIGAAETLMDTLVQREGFKNLGESLASLRSSRRTTGPSKRTS